MSWDAELYEAKHSFVWQAGSGILELLQAKPGEHILDLGCGTGQLTQKIADAGAVVTGVDVSPAMVGQARQNYPKLRFALQDATALKYDQEFDAVFSNAALHWVLDAPAAAHSIAQALKHGGRLVAELGGHGNIATIENAIRSVLGRHMQQVPDSQTYFPTVSQYATVLEAKGLEVQFAQLFDRSTPLEGADGMENWLRQFGWYYFEPLDKDAQKQAIAETVEELRPALWRDGGWTADYRRLRVIAAKVQGTRATQ